MDRPFVTLPRAPTGTIPQTSTTAIIPTTIILSLQSVPVTQASQRLCPPLGPLQNVLRIRMIRWTFHSSAVQFVWKEMKWFVDYVCIRARMKVLDSGGTRGGVSSSQARSPTSSAGTHTQHGTRSLHPSRRQPNGRPTSPFQNPTRGHSNLTRRSLRTGGPHSRVSLD